MCDQQENPKRTPRGSPTEPWRVQNGVPEGPKWSQEGPKWSPMGQDGGQEGAQCHPQGFREAQVPLSARQSDTKMRPREPRAGSCTVLRPILGPRGRPKGSKIGAKSGPKVSPQTSSFQIAFWSQILSILGSEKRHFWDPKTEPSAHTDCKVHMQNVLEKPTKNQHSRVGAW